jgi:dephospho-CoA kinase
MKIEMIKVGITGGIGSGKSTVCKIFELLGVPVYYADDRAKELMTSSKKLKRQLSQLLGEDTYDENGELNRIYIANKIFENEELRIKMNKIVHPIVIEDGKKWHKKHSSFKYTLKEAALLIESGSYKEMDKILVVTAPEHLRIERVKLRNPSWSEADIQKRIKSQLNDEDFAKYADWAIDNSGTTSIISQIIIIHKQLI